MHTFILFIILFSSDGQAVGVHTQEFKSEHRCEQARLEIIHRTQDNESDRTINAVRNQDWIWCQEK